MKKWWSKISVEPCVLFFAVCQGLYVIVAQQLYIQKVCKVNLNFSAAICDNITNYQDEQLQVQKYVSILQGYSQVLQALPGVVFALFAGPWSDIHGRKLLIIVSTFGYFFNNGVFIVNTIWFNELKAEYLLFECLQDCTGGYVTFFLACYSYITDITTKEERTKRLAYFDGLFPLGFFLGMAVSGPITEKFGFLVTFCLSLGMAAVTLTYAIFLKDSRTLRPVEVQAYLDQQLACEGLEKQSSGKCSFFQFENVIQGFTAVFKKRGQNLRSFIVMLISTFLLEVFLTNGRGPTMYLFFRRKFSWEMSKFGFYVGMFGFVGMLCEFIAVPFLSNKLHWHDSIICLASVSSSVVHNMILCFMPAGDAYEWLVYASGAITFLSACTTTTIRSLITKCVSPFEVGKVFSVLAAFQSCVPLFAGPIFSNIYSSTVAEFPGAFLMFCICLYTVMVVLLSLINTGMRKQGVLHRTTGDDFLPPQSGSSDSFKPVHMERLLNKKDDENRQSKFVLETAPEGDRLREVAMDPATGRSSIYKNVH